jgi:hypothetical protein
MFTKDDLFDRMQPGHLTVFTVESEFQRHHIIDWMEAQIKDTEEVNHIQLLGNMTLMGSIDMMEFESWLDDADGVIDDCFEDERDILVIEPDAGDQSVLDFAIHAARSEMGVFVFTSADYAFVEGFWPSVAGLNVRFAEYRFIIGLTVDPGHIVRR